MAEDGWDRVVGLDLADMLRSLAFILEAGEPANGLGEASDIQIPFWKGHSSRRTSLLARGVKTRGEGAKRGLLYFSS